MRSVWSQESWYEICSKSISSLFLLFFYSICSFEIVCFTHRIWHGDVFFQFSRMTFCSCFSAVVTAKITNSLGRTKVILVFDLNRCFSKTSLRLGYGPSAQTLCFELNVDACCDSFQWKMVWKYGTKVGLQSCSLWVDIPKSQRLQSPLWGFWILLSKAWLGWNFIWPVDGISVISVSYLLYKRLSVFYTCKFFSQSCLLKEPFNSLIWLVHANSGNHVCVK